MGDIMKHAYYITIISGVVFLMWGMGFINCQNQNEKEIKLYFREDWKEIPAEIPVSQKHVNNPELILKLYGSSADSIKKSHHDRPADDPWYVWSGLCVDNWALTLHKENSVVDLSNGASIRWRTKQFGGRVLRVVLGLENGTWLVSEQGSGETSDWSVFTLSLDTLRWRIMNIDNVTAGKSISNVDLNKVKYIGCTDLMPGGGSKACSRLDWIEVYGK